MKLCRPYGARVNALLYPGLTPWANLSFAPAGLAYSRLSPFCRKGRLKRPSLAESEKRMANSVTSFRPRRRTRRRSRLRPSSSAAAPSPPGAGPPGGGCCAERLVHRLGQLVRSRSQVLARFVHRRRVGAFQRLLGVGQRVLDVGLPPAGTILSPCSRASSRAVDDACRVGLALPLPPFGLVLGRCARPPPPWSLSLFQAGRA